MASFVEDPEVGIVDENAVAALAGEFAGDASGDEGLHGFAGCRESHRRVAAKVRESEDRAFAQGGEDSQGTGCGAAGRSGAAYVFLE